jgi:hypothetical protein
VERLMQEQRSSEAKKAEVTPDPNQLAQLSMAGGGARRSGRVWSPADGEATRGGLEAENGQPDPGETVACF